MLTKGAIGNLVNRYRAVLKKCNLINTFGSLAVASMLVLGGAGVASAADYATNDKSIIVGSSAAYENVNANVSFQAKTYHQLGSEWKIYDSASLSLGGEGKNVFINIASDYADSQIAIRAYAYNGKEGNKPYVNKSATISISGNELNIVNNRTDGYGLFAGGTTCQDRTAEGGRITVDSNKLYVKAVHGLSAMSSGTLIVNSKDIEIDSTTAIHARGMSKIAINAKEDGSVLHEDAKIKLTGDIRFDGYYDVATAFVDLNLTGKESKLNGNILSSIGAASTDTTADGTTERINLGLYDGATWKSTATSFVNGLTLKNGIIDISENKGTVLVTHRIEGEGTAIVDVNNTTGNIDATRADTSKAALVITATQNADEVTEEQAKGLLKRVAGVANTTVKLAEGDVMGELTVSADGNASMAKNTIMEATLNQASVTTVAIDKLLTNDVRKRLGDLRTDKNESGVWMRWDGGKLQGNGLSNDFNTIQIGGDTKVAKNCRLGVAGSFTHGDAEFARGTAELEGFSLATYATWMSDNGMFADVVARLGQFNNEMNVEGRKGKLDNRVFSLSGEYGWRLPVCEQFFVEPQVELAYTYVSSDTLELGNAKYLIDSVDSLTGRAGLVAGWNLPNDMGNVYARASVLQQFMGDAKISGSVGSATNVQELDGNDTWLEYGIGANVKLTDKTYIWADVERTSGAELDEEWRGTVGIRYSF